MTKEDIITQLDFLEEEMKKLKLRVSQLTEENARLRTVLAAVDDRTKQFKPSKQTGHPDGHFMER